LTGRSTKSCWSQPGNIDHPGAQQQHSPTLIIENMTLPFLIRRAVPAEAETISSLGIRSKAVWQYSAEAMATFEQELTILPGQIEESPVYVLVNGEQILGYYTLREVSTELVELEHLFIDPEHFSQGYGSNLLQHAIALAKAGGYSRLVIQSDPNAAGFYQKHNIPLVKQIPSSIPGRTIPCFELQF